MSNDNGNQEKFDQWCVLDLFGHQRTAGHVTEATIGGCAFIRIDVPEGDGFRTEFYGNGAIYSMRPVSEEIAREVVKSHSNPPVSSDEVSSLLKRLQPAPEAMQRDVPDDEDFDGDQF
jgi:hypothetical protein